jgi:hypothetical protein
MKRQNTVVLAVFVVLLSAVSAWALPPPMTEAEMMQASDLVVDAECVDIVCEGPPVQDAEKTTTTYVSTLFPSFSYKGGLPNSIRIRGFLYDWIGPEPVGGWHQEPVPVGWIGKLYLVQENDGTYTKVWWNAMEEDTQSSNPQPLPSCEDVQADGGVPSDAALTDAAGETDGTAGDSDAGGGPATNRDGCSCRQLGPLARGGRPWSLLPLLLLFGLGLATKKRRARR